MLQKIIQICDLVMITLNKLTNAFQSLEAQCLLIFKEILDLLKLFENATV